MAEQLLGERLLSVENVHKYYDNREILKPMTFTIHRTARIGILGTNGSGKSTFMKIIAGIDKEYTGKVVFDPGTTIGYVAQEPYVDPEKTVRENIEDGVRHVRGLLDEYNAVSEKLGEVEGAEMEKLMEKMERLQTEIDAIDAWEIDHRVEMAMEALRVPPGETSAKTLSGGERRRVAICRELMAYPDLLILDEPTNHLDAATVEWLEVFIDNYPGTVVMVTHDRYFLDNVANYMVEIMNGRLYIYEGNYSDFLAKKAERMKLAERTERNRQKVLGQELEWMNSNPKARTGKSKARVANYRRLLEDGPEEFNDQVQLMIPTGPRLGDKVVSIVDLKKGFGGRTLIDGLNLTVAPGEMIGITGPNGMGKTTLFRMILGQEKPDAGRVELGETVKVVTVEQNRDRLDNSKTVYDEISEGLERLQVGRHSYHVREYLNRFQFRGTLQSTLVGNLSGGERNRLLLAKTLRQGANLLLLDEPTNDIDLETLQALEEALLNFAGSALIISHDRFFLDRLVNRIVVFESEGNVRVFDGNFEAYFERRKEEIAASGGGKGKLLKTSYRKLRK